MHAYQYKHGDRPLEGFTIQRGVGRGGFGEVYYALSDSGREVALKTLLGAESIELRGVSQCMNLKSPYLVTIFDVKHNEQGRPFVIMEYVAGPSLRELLEESPSGLGTQKAAFFLRELAKGLTYLHERGIVHRDLKPGNVFYEDGLVKIGDYGLSKAMSTSQHSGQTITVGTVHYMAPEIGQGRYDRGIDIYALGCVLFEMLTGHVPFFGASHGEILMKHLVDAPDVIGIEEPFATVIRKAMAKNPAERYQSVQEMVEAVFGAEHIRESVSVFSPDSLSVVAERVGRKVTVGGPGSSAELPRTFGTEPRRGEVPSDAWTEFGQWIDHAGTRLSDAAERLVAGGGRLRDRFGSALDEPALPTDEAMPAIEPLSDPLSHRQRRTLALITAAAIAVGTTLLNPYRYRNADPAAYSIFTFLLIVGAAAGLVWARARLLPKLTTERGLVQRLALAGPACIGGLILSLPFMGMAPSLARDDVVAATYFGIFASFFILNWSNCATATRPQRVSLRPAIAAAGIAFVIAAITEGMAVIAMAVAAGTALAAQVAWPFTPRGSAVVAGARRSAGESRERGHRSTSVPPPLPQPPGSGGQPARLTAASNGAPVASWGRPVRPIMRMVWFLVTMTALGISLFCTIMALVEGPSRSRHGDDFSVFLSFGASFLMLCLFSVGKLFQREVRSHWRDTAKPFLLYTCAASILMAFVWSAWGRLRGDEQAIAVFFIVFPLILAIIIMAIPNRAVQGLFGRQIPEPIRPKSALGGVSNRFRLWAALLTAPAMVGVCGLQRFYVGKIGTGILWFFTGGLLGIGQIYDLIMIATGEFRDKQERKLVAWQSFDELKGMPMGSIAGANASAPIDERRDPAGVASAMEPDTAERPVPVSGLEPVPQPWSPISAYSEGARERARTNLPLAILGHGMVLPALVIGVFWALRVSELIAAGFPDASLAREFDQLFGYSGWPRLLDRLASTLGMLFLLAAVIVLTLARRRAGAAHTARAVLATIGLLFTAMMLYETFYRVNWPILMSQIDENLVGPAIEQFLDYVNPKAALLSAVLLLGSIIMLAWPEKRRVTTLSASGSGGGCGPGLGERPWSV